MSVSSVTLPRFYTIDPFGRQEHPVETGVFGKRLEEGAGPDGTFLERGHLLDEAADE
jgi:hypothetical protein